MFEDHILPFLIKFDSDFFRQSKLYKETVDVVLRTHMKTLKDIYQKASVVDSVPDEDSIMSIGEFVRFHAETMRKDDTVSLNSRELGPLFNLSIMTQVDEIFSERHAQMSFLEFVEALCRVADRVVTTDTSLQHNQAVTTKNIGRGQQLLQAK